MAGSAIDEVMNQLFEYHNYIVCSKGTVEFNGKQHTVSFGILGSVYTMNADDMVKALEGAEDLQIEETTSSSTDESPSVSDNNSDGSEEDGLGASVQKKLERQGKPGHGSGCRQGKQETGRENQPKTR